MEERKYRYMAEYETGSAARKLKPDTERREINRPYIVERPEAGKKPKTVMEVDLLSVLLLVAAISATVLMCISYLKLQSDIVQMDKAIAAMEQEITAISRENDAVEAVLENEIIDLEYIYQIAVGVLGMVYPNNNEVVYYDYEDSGYFRQYQDIPKQ